MENNKPDAEEFVARMKGNLLSYGPFLAATNAGEGIAGDFSDAITIITAQAEQIEKMYEEGYNSGREAEKAKTDMLQSRIERMCVNGLSPESRLNGYAVVGRRQVKRIKELCDQLKAAQIFARHVIKQECWGLADLDGGDIQDLAEKLGLIVKHIATEADIGEDSDFEVGDTIYKFSDTLKGGEG